MNAREGSRRLALLVGIVGAVFGGFVSYLQLQQVLSQRALHNSFQAAASKIGKQAKPCVVSDSALGAQANPDLPTGAKVVSTSGNTSHEFIMIAPDGTPGTVDAGSEQRAAKAGYQPAIRLYAIDGKSSIIDMTKAADFLKAGYKTQPISAPTVAMIFPDGSTGIIPNENTQAAANDGAKPAIKLFSPDGIAKFVDMAKAGDFLRAGYKPERTTPKPTVPMIRPDGSPTMVDCDHVNDAMQMGYRRTVHVDPKTGESSTSTEWDRSGKPIEFAPVTAASTPPDGTLVSIATDDGRTLYPTPAPSIWSYAILFIWPLIGFFVPWGTIRGIAWVVTGFTQMSP